jgi:uncharacterized protein (TIGR03083 family)
MDVDQYLTALEADGELLGRAAERAGLDAVVPNCPPWQIRQLLQHIGYVHRWAAAHVVQASPGPIGGLTEDEVLARGPSDDKLIAWFRQGHADLLKALRSADAGLSCWTFLDAPSPLAFWARRQAHETAIHRADAEAASGPISAFGPAFAADGIDELLVGFAPRERPAIQITVPYALDVQCLDTGDEWSVDLDPAGITTHRGTGPADSLLAGAASDLYLTLWNRLPPDTARLSISGRPDALERWHATMRVGWN